MNDEIHTATIETEYGTVTMTSAEPATASGQALRMARDLERDRNETARIEMDTLLADMGGFHL